MGKSGCFSERKTACEHSNTLQKLPVTSDIPMKEKWQPVERLKSHNDKTPNSHSVYEQVQNYVWGETGTNKVATWELTVVKRREFMISVSRRRDTSA